MKLLEVVRIPETSDETFQVGPQPRPSNRRVLLAEEFKNQQSVALSKILYHGKYQGPRQLSHNMFSAVPLFFFCSDFNPLLTLVLNLLLLPRFDNATDFWFLNSSASKTRRLEGLDSGLF